MNTETMDLRSSMVDTLIRLADEGMELRVLVSDSTSTSKIKPFMEKFPQRVINVGIAEQNLVGIAAGLSIGNIIPITANAACFLTARSNEQVKNDICYSNLNVKLIGLNAGLSYGPLGGTHHSIDDIAIMNGFGNILIFAPSDSFETEQIIRFAVEYNGPVYIRLDSDKFPILHDQSYEFIPGKADIIREGDDISVIALGSVVCEAAEAAVKAAENGINADVISISSVRPLDEAAIIKSIRKTGRVIVVEEHSLNGGLCSIISSIMTRNRVTADYIELGLPRGEFAKTGPRKELRAYYKIDASGIYNTIKSLVHEPSKI